MATDDTPAVMPRIISRGDFVEIVTEGAYSLDMYRRRTLWAASSIRSVADREGWNGQMVRVIVDDFGKRTELHIWDNIDRVIAELSRPTPKDDTNA